MGLASLDPPPKFSTDLLALQVAGRGIVPPTSDIRWGTAATGGACTWFHVDSNGLGVFVIMKCGLKIWFFIRDDEGRFLKINAFHDFELDEAKGHQLEVVVLRPGTQLYAANYSSFCVYHSNVVKHHRVMRPNTVHAAFTPVASICHGGHFYSSSTMQDSLPGIIHSFVDHIKITNTNHPPVASLLRYMARFYHSGLIELGVEAFTGEYHLYFPDCIKLSIYLSAPETFHIPWVETVNGALDLFSLCFLVIFGNVFSCAKSTLGQ